MKFKLNTLTVTFFLLYAFTFFVTLNLPAQEKDIIEEELVEKDMLIKGKVVPVEWDKKGKLKSVAIRVVDSEDKSTDYQYIREITIEEYYVVDNKKGRKLLALAGKTVIVSGIVKYYKDCECKTIYVKRYDILEPELGHSLFPMRNLSKRGVIYLHDILRVVLHPDNWDRGEGEMDFYTECENQIMISTQKHKLEIPRIGG